MGTNEIAVSHWDDLVFQHRNKRYGAYLLRRAYARRLLSGLALTILFVGLVLSLHNFYPDRNGGDKVVPELRGVGVDLTPTPQVERKADKKPTPPRKNNVQNRALLITTEEVEQEADAEAVTEYVSDGGVESGLSGASDATGDFSLPSPEIVIEPDVFELAEVMPQYEGGLEAMMKFIQKKIRYPRAPRQMKIEGTVYVRFVVNGDGSVSNVELLRGIHPDCDREAMRVISLLPAWKGGSHNGRPVSVRMVIPIKFRLTG